jgi:hypothetical protein
MVRRLTPEEIRAQIPAARAAGRKIQREAWWPVEVAYDRRADEVVIHVRDGKTLHVPRSHLPELTGATCDQVQRLELAGEAIRWPELDIDVSVLSLLTDLLGPRHSTRSAGRQGGSARSEAKARAARANGRPSRRR